jgi:N-acetylglucosamine-6-phosphate deacetylase
MTSFAAMERCAVFVEDGKISDVFSQKRFEQKRFDPETQIIDVNEAIIAPGLIDTHIHGFGGWGTEDSSAESVIEMSRLLVQYGVTAFNPTIYPMESEQMLGSVKAAASAIGREDGAQIMGLHLEGPFISPERLGVMKAGTVQNVDLA